MAIIDLLKDMNINNIPNIPFNEFLKREINLSNTGMINIETYHTLKLLEACDVPQICMIPIVRGYNDFAFLEIYDYSTDSSIIRTDKKDLYNNIKSLNKVVSKYNLIPTRYGIYPDMTNSELTEYFGYIYLLTHNKRLSLDNKKGILKYLNLGVSRARVLGYILKDNFVIIPEVESMEEKYSIKKAIDIYIEENNIKITLP